MQNIAKPHLVILQPKIKNFYVLGKICSNSTYSEQNNEQVYNKNFLDKFKILILQKSEIL